MTLAAYLRRSHESVSGLARELGCSQPHLFRLISGERKASVWLALQIEERTDGKVRAEQVPMTLRSRERLRKFLKRTEEPAGA